jgi:outer membrane receptor protein involved in Fe transport
MKKILLLGTLLVCSCSSLLWAQEKFVTGTVTAADDASAIPGVNIVVAGTNNGVITDMDGKYKIGVPDKGKLIFSFVGMISQELAFENLSVIDVKLVSDARILSEVVVTGSGVATTKAKLGISVETISGKNLPQTPSASVDQALVGKIPGAQITSGNGTPGALGQYPA